MKRVLGLDYVHFNSLPNLISNLYSLISFKGALERHRQNLFLKQAQYLPNNQKESIGKG